jgi:hypothetical protein
MNLLRFIFNFNYVFVFQILKSWPLQYIGFKLADLEIVTALRILILPF